MIKTTKEIADLFNGFEYTSDFSEEVINDCKESDIVIVMGYSDDLIELDGAICDEADKYGGGRVHFNKDGFCSKSKSITTLDARWCKNDISGWSFKTTIPHQTFDIFDRRAGIDDFRGRGIVFSLKSI